MLCPKSIERFHTFFATITLKKMYAVLSVFLNRQFLSSRTCEFKYAALQPWKYEFWMIYESQSKYIGYLIMVRHHRFISNRKCDSDLSDFLFIVYVTCLNKWGSNTKCNNSIRSNTNYLIAIELEGAVVKIDEKRTA